MALEAELDERRKLVHRLENELLEATDRNEREKERAEMLKAAYDACQVRMVDDALIRQNMGIKPAARPTQHALPLSSPAAAVAAALASPAAVPPRAVTLAPSPARTSPSAAAAAYLGPPPEPMSAKPKPL